MANSELIQKATVLVYEYPLNSTVKQNMFHFRAMPPHLRWMAAKMRWGRGLVHVDGPAARPPVAGRVGRRAVAVT